MKPFEKLTFRGQLVRLRMLALKALEEYDLHIHSLKLISTSFNTIYRLRTEDGQHYALRISLPGERSLGEICSETEWLHALRNETDLQIPQPVANRGGDLVTSSNIPSVPQTRHCAVFKWLPGMGLFRRVTPQNLYKLGKTAAVLNRHAQTFELPANCSLKTANRIYLNSQKSIFSSDNPPGSLSSADLKTFCEAEELIDKQIERLYTQNTKAHIIHGDLHQGNVKIYKGKLSILDFDDSLLGHAVQDIGFGMYYFHGYPNFEELFASYQAGYREHQPWPESFAGQVRYFMIARALLVSDYMLKSENPRLKEIAPRYVARDEKFIRKTLQKLN